MAPVLAECLGWRPVLLSWLRPGSRGCLRKAIWVWGETSTAEKGLGGPEGRSGERDCKGHCLPGWTIAHVQLKPVQETNLRFIFLVGPFFFFRLLTEKKKILKSRKLKKEKKKKEKILVHEIKIFFYSLVLMSVDFFHCFPNLDLPI